MGARAIGAIDEVQKSDIPVTESSGNIFAAMDVPEPEEELTNAQLASHVRHAIQRRRCQGKVELSPSPAK